jgi:hypothetical protein
VKTSQLDELDRQLVHALMLPPRASFRQLAAVLGLSDQTRFCQRSGSRAAPDGSRCSGGVGERRFG